MKKTKQLTVEMTVCGKYASKANKLSGYMQTNDEIKSQQNEMTRNLCALLQHKGGVVVRNTVSIYI